MLHDMLDEDDEDDEATRRDAEVEVTIKWAVPRELDPYLHSKAKAFGHGAILYVHRTTSLGILVHEFLDGLPVPRESILCYEGKVRFVDDNNTELSLWNAVENMAGPGRRNGRGKGAGWCGQRELHVHIRLNEKGEQMLREKTQAVIARRVSIRLANRGRVRSRKLSVGFLRGKMSEDLVAVIEEKAFGEAHLAGKEWAAKFIQSCVRRHFRTVRVQTLIGKAIDVQVDGRAATVKMLKLAIQEKEGIPPDQQRLVFQGTTLSDDKQTIAELGYPLHVRASKKQWNLSSIHLVLRLR